MSEPADQPHRPAAPISRADRPLRRPTRGYACGGLAASYPAGLTARRRPAWIYRLSGEPTEAGRWAHLDTDRDRPRQAGRAPRDGLRTGGPPGPLAARARPRPAPRPGGAGRAAGLRLSGPRRSGAPGLRGARCRHLRLLVTLAPALRYSGAPGPSLQSRCSAASQSRHRCCSSSGGYHGSPGRAGR
ncbi:DUF6584 family protein [Kitasatospora sp. NPDC091257]|uniref:DUF6584 family protein n=1 Tax=Kitasatospora sp. NPDC091257 TaxID=3364084 RepID=UPI003809A042